MVRTRQQVADAAANTQDPELLQRELLQAQDRIRELEAAHSSEDDAGAKLEHDAEMAERWRAIRADMQTVLDRCRDAEGNLAMATRSVKMLQEAHADELAGKDKKHAGELIAAEEEFKQREEALKQLHAAELAEARRFRVPPPAPVPDNEGTVRIAYVRACVFNCARDGATDNFHLSSPSADEVAASLREHMIGLPEAFVSSAVARAQAVAGTAIDNNCTMAVAAGHGFTCNVHGMSFFV